MPESVRDILGKGFLYEQRIEVETIQEIITGTIATFVGGAHWGPVGEPTLVLESFVDYFGNPLIRDDGADFAGQAAVFHLNYSPFCWFTRVTDGTELKARLALTKDAQIAKLYGDAIVKDKSFVVETGVNDALKIQIDENTGSYSDFDVTLNPTSACSDVESSAITADPTSILPADKAYNFTKGTDYFSFIVDDVEYRYVVQEESVTNLDEPDFLRLVVSDQDNDDVDDLGYAPSQYSDTPNVDGGTGLTNWDDYDSSSFGGTSGYQELGLAVDDSVNAGLLAADTPHYFSVNGTEYNITAADADTYADIVTKMEAAVTADDLSVSIEGTAPAADIRITNKDVGNQSTVEIEAGITGTDLLSDLDGFTALETAVDGTEGSYIERFAYALKTFVVVPTLMSVKGLSQVNAEAAADEIVTTGSNKLVLSSREQGAASKVIVYNFPKLFTSASTSNPVTSTASNTSITTVVSEINTVLSGSGLAWVDNTTGYIVIGTDEAGAGYKIQIATVANDFYEELGLDNVIGTEYAGADVISDAGTFEANYAGEDGNEIVINNRLTADGKVLTIYHRDQVVGTFFNYSLTVADSNYIGNMIDSDDETLSVVTFATPSGLTVLPEFPVGNMTLTGGTSGLSGLTDADYNGALEQYKNLDLYNVDIVAVPGNVSESVADTIQEVCEYRKDCFGVIDIPENKAGLPTLGGSIYNSIAWHNAATGSGRSSKLDSQYITTYFPWVQINDGTNIDWYAPSVRAIGCISQSDKVAGHKYAAPAGPLRTTITDIEGLAIYLREDEKNRLYADELGNSINPIVFDKNRGFYIDGQKNTDREFGAISRLNVLRTALSLKRRMYQIAPDFFWEPLTQNTMDEFAEAIELVMEELFDANAIKGKDDPNYGYTIQVDTSINTPAIEAQRGLIGIITWTPVRSIEKIKVVSVIRDLRVDVVLGV